MQKFEYDAREGWLSDAALSNLGSQGWELVNAGFAFNAGGCKEYFYFFKRQLPES